MSRASLYHTKQRQEILSCLEKLKDGATAALIENELRKVGISIGKATIYRHLDKLSKSGVVCRYHLEGVSAACYRISGPCDSPAELRLNCMECGKTVHLPCGFLNDLRTHLSVEHKFSIQTEHTVLYGRCGHCEKSERDIHISLER